MANKVRITEDTGICIVRDLATGNTTAATYYGEMDETSLVVVKCANGQYVVRYILDFITDEDLYDCYVKDGNINCEVIGKVDTRAYDESMEKEDKRQALRSKMLERARALKEDVYYKIFAEQDEEFAKLYEEYIRL